MLAFIRPVRLNIRIIQKLMLNRQIFLDGAIWLKRFVSGFEFTARVITLD